MLDHKEGVRVQALAYRKDNRSILAADTHHRIRSYNLEDEQSDKTMIQENHGIMTFTIDESDRYALLNIASQVSTYTQEKPNPYSDFSFLLIHSYYPL